MLLCIRYLKLLVQGMAVKLDMRFISNVMEAIVLDKSVDSDNDLKMANFARDLDSANSQLNAYAELESSVEVQQQFEYVHISPILVSKEYGRPIMRTLIHQKTG